MYVEIIRIEDQTITGNEHSNPDLVTMHKIYKTSPPASQQGEIQYRDVRRFWNNIIISKLPHVEIKSHCTSKIVMSRETVLSNKLKCRNANKFSIELHSKLHKEQKVFPKHQ